MLNKNSPELLMEAHAWRLNELQAEKNDGRGVTCVRSIVTYLNRHQFEEAQGVFQVDGDKIRQYPDIEAYCVDIFGCRLHGIENCKGSLCR